MKKYSLELLGEMPGVTVEHYLGEYEGTREVLLFVNIDVTKDGIDEARTLLFNDAPVFLNPSWDKKDLLNNVADYLDVGEEDARVRLQKCGLLPDTNKEVK